MNAPVISGLVLAGIATAMLVAMAFSAVPGSGSARARRASQLARYFELPLPPDLMGWLGDRQRVRQLTTLFVVGPLLPPLAFWRGYAWWRAMARSLQFPQPVAMSIWIAVLVPAIVAIARHHRELRWARSHGLPLLAGDPDRRLAEVVPPVMTLLARLGVVTLAAAAVVAGIIGPGASAGRLWLAVAAAVVSLAALGTAEIVQLRLIRAPRLGSSPAALAFDDAFLSETVVDIANFPLAVAVLSSVFGAFVNVPRASVLAPAVGPVLWFGWLGFLLLTPATSWPLRKLLRHDPAPPTGMNELSSRTGYGYTWW
ncbi:MAG TPA: hypothetical protein VMU94_09575 [Streptosporangiaceae bacterium]|nr:hypothetical protein [Streptosporangiaceae bacterium]